MTYFGLHIVRRPAAAWLACGVMVFTGCSRAFYRLQADHDVYCLENYAAVEPLSSPEEYDIRPDPRSRMFDPFSADYPPMPPDDPDSHRLMHCVDCRPGYPCWHANGDTPYVENPDWRACLPVDENGYLVLNRRSSVRLALLNSGVYQTELEDLYLSALDVSFERFQFDTQFFGGYGIQYTADGGVRSGTGSSSSELSLDTRDIQARKMFASGSELVVGLANTLVWQFAGTNNHTATSLLDFSLVQPLLRRGGRDRVLEQLTLAERALLGNVRQLERFQRGFYTAVVTGRDGGPGPARGGGFLGVGPVGASQSGGFLSLLEDQQNIRNQQANVSGLRNSLVQLEEYHQTGRIDYLQVAQARQALNNAQSRLLSLQSQYELSLDNFKITLGLPPDQCVRIADDFLDQFNLLDPEIVPTQNELTDLQSDVGDVILRILQVKYATDDAQNDPESAPAPGLVEQPIEWTEQLEADLQAILAQLGQIEEVRRRVIDQQVPRARADIDQLRAVVDTRVEALAQLQRVEDLLCGDYCQHQPLLPDVDIDPTMTEPARVRQWPGRLDELLTKVNESLVGNETELAEIIEAVHSLLDEGPNLEPAELSRRLELQVLWRVPDQVSQLSNGLLELSLVQARARTESITVQTVDLDPVTALEIASSHRRDWKNTRAALVDVWRLIQFTANDLESDLDLVFSGDMGNVGDNPFDFRSTNGRLRVGLEFDAPLTRLAERNVYRESQIEFQRARRAYYQFVDQVNSGLRDTLRSMQLNRLVFELRREAVHVAIEQVELARLRLQQPPKPNEEQTFGATTARDIVSALSDLLNAQNTLLGVWVNDQVLRRTLDLDLGTMQLDADGFWIDPGPIDTLADRSSLRPTEGPLPAPRNFRPSTGLEVTEEPTRRLRR